MNSSVSTSIISSWFNDSDLNNGVVSTVHGFVQDNRTGEKVALLVGKWDEAMYYMLGDPTTKPKGYDPMTEVVLLWERNRSVTKTRYNLSPFAISLNELTLGLMEILPPTDLRLRPDQLNGVSKCREVKT
ncbi:oxysterol-binding protein-related protein 1D isoform X2 [Cucumis melo var. makuwa]|uniref:Oxysterol-binding protein-related protein 1D isoform X2 n=1 Tax=Cucumis melo var. makuwa TaxID=1194695 RepID=A0A5D3DA36_CUCMM|nr:oxysterol-binding protein-related protein 1D isoform X2 [Cucumis melo var. makuwa]